MQPWNEGQPRDEAGCSLLEDSLILSISTLLPLRILPIIFYLSITQSQAHLGRKPLSRTSLKCVQATTLGGAAAVAKRCRMAQSRPTPSQVSVPLPNSSMMHSDLHPAGRRAQGAPGPKYVQLLECFSPGPTHSSTCAWNWHCLRTKGLD